MKRLLPKNLFWPRFGGQAERVIAFVLLGAALTGLCSCDKEDDGAGQAPRPAPVAGEGTAPAPAASRLLAPDDKPQGDVAWMEGAAWGAARPGDGSELRPAFKLLYFRAPRELGCSLLERFSLHDEIVLKYLRDHAACRWLSLTSREAEGPARRYEIKNAPVLVVLDREGGYAGAVVGYRPPARLLNELKALAEAAEIRRRRAAELAARLAGTPPAESAKRIEALDAAAELARERRLFAQVVEFSRALEEVPGVHEARSVPAILGREAQALAELGRAEEADRAFERALAADRLKLHGEDLAFRRAQCRTQSGDFEKAAVLWERFGADYPSSPRAEAAAFNRAYGLLLAGKRAEAARTLSALLAKAPSAEVREALHTLLYALAGSDAALAALQAGEARRTYLADCLEEGRVFVRKYSCQDCHLAIEPQLRTAQTTCVECHLQIRRLEKEPEHYDALVKANPHFFRNCARVRHLLRAPSLFGLGARVRPEWIRKYLENPWDLRPHLEESMLQMNLAPNEIDALVRYFQAIAVVAGQQPPAAGEELPRATKPGALAARGRAVFEQKKCFVCHQFGNVNFGAGQGEWAWEEGRAEAPNLRFARERLPRRTAREWIRQPERMSPGTRMPKFELDDQELEALVEFLFCGDLGVPPADLNKAPPRVKAAHVPMWEEVYAAVFQETCVHCHMRDAEGGAGNVGAYGFRARRLDLSSYAGIRRGALQPDGTRAEILKPRPSGLPPLLLERLYKRADENKRDKIEPFRDPLTELYAPRQGRVAPGMPLGHPALTPEQFALLEAWLAAGAPGPAAKPLGDPPGKAVERRE